MVDFVAGVFDTVTAGLTKRLRDLVGLSGLVDESSTGYQLGGYVGQAVTVALTVSSGGAWGGVAGC